jgi:hypothetical protein
MIDKILGVDVTMLNGSEARDLLAEVESLEKRVKELEAENKRKTKVLVDILERNGSTPLICGQ